MGLFDFVKEAGSKIFGGDDDKPAAAPQRDLEDVLADKAKGAALAKLVGDTGMKVEGLSVKFRAGKATLQGQAPSQAEREKVVLLVGNTQGVSQVDDQLTVAAAGGGAATAAAGVGATMYTVKSGDSLSKIAKAHYGNAMKYTVIFEANTPMLKDPDKIYPGQVLRIPKLDA